MIDDYFKPGRIPTVDGAFVPDGGLTHTPSYLSDNPDGASGGSSFNFAYAYDFGGGGTTGGYGNICGCTRSQMTRYGLAQNHTYCGSGHWVRVGTPQTCTDGVQNQDEVGIDCGGACTSCVGTCSDGVRNQGETGVDCGGPNCAACPPT